MWYVGNHKGHLPVHCQHVVLILLNLSPDINQFVMHLLKEHVFSILTKPVLQQFGKNISEVGAYHHCDKLEYELLKETSKDPYGTPFDKLIAE